jgi:hypothetical protein
MKKNWDRKSRVRLPLNIQYWCSLLKAIYFFLYCFIYLKQGKQLTVYTWVILKDYMAHTLAWYTASRKRSSFLFNYSPTWTYPWRRHIHNQKVVFTSFYSGYDVCTSKKTTSSHITFENTRHWHFLLWISSIRWYANLIIVPHRARLPEKQ